MFVCMSHFFASTRIEACWYKKNLFDYFVIAHCLWDGWSSSFSMHFKTTKNTLQAQNLLKIDTSYPITSIFELKS